MVEMGDRMYTASKEEINKYINDKPFLMIEPDGGSPYWKVRIGERSCMEGVYTKPANAEKALRQHVGNVIIANKKREAKKNAKKDQS